MKNFNNFKNRFKITDEKFDDFYSSLINNDDSESVQHSLDILIYDVKKNSNYIKKEDYDFILKTIEDNGKNQYNQKEIIDNIDDVPDNELLLFPGYWRNLINTITNISTKNFFTKMLDNIESRSPIIITNKENKSIKKYKVTETELKKLKTI